MKLTNAIRDEIVSNAMRKSEIPGRRDTLKGNLKMFAKDVYETAVVPTIPAALVAAISTPEGKAETRRWLTWTTGLYIKESSRFGPWNWRNRKDSRGYKEHYLQILSNFLEFDDPVLVASHPGTIDLLDYPTLNSAAYQLSDYHRETNSKEENISSKLRQITRSANTKAQLLAVWPEGAPFIPAETKPQQALVPVDEVLSLNKALGISQ